MRRRSASVVLATLALAVATVVPAMGALAKTYGEWGAPVTTGNTLNSADLEGCPSISRDGSALYFASNRSGGLGGIDIWVSFRDDTGWGAPVNLGSPVNTSSNDLCPTPMRDGKGLLFVSNRGGGCGGWDIYSTRLHVKKGWSEPVNLGCSVNSSADEASPFLVGDEFYFSSTRAGGSSIYVAPVDDEGSVGTPSVVFAGARPNIRRDGLEMFLDRTGACGGLDLWTSTRTGTEAAWSVPANLGCTVNSAGNDLRASLSWDGTRLYFGSDRSGSLGSQDVYVTTR